MIIQCLGCVLYTAPCISILILFMLFTLYPSVFTVFVMVSSFAALVFFVILLLHALFICAEHPELVYARRHEHGAMHGDNYLYSHLKQ